MSSLTDSMSSNSSLSFLLLLDASDLKSIEDAFHTNTRRFRTRFVNRKEFGSMLDFVLTKGNVDDYDQLFDMVDVTREGVIDWDCFSNYLLLGYYEREDRIRVSQVPQWKDIKKVHSPHKSALCRVLLCSGHTNRYCTVSKDGLLCMLDENHEVKRTCQIHTNPEEIRSKDLWITDAAIMLNINKIAFATTSREIWIYDLVATNDFCCQYKIIGLRDISLCMTYWSNKNNNNNTALLAFGDTGGYVHAIFFHNVMTALFEKPWKSEQNQEQCFTVHIENVKAGHFKSASCLQFKAHSAWVRQIIFIPLLDCFVTCSTTSTDSIVLAWLGKSRTDVRINDFQIPLGINGFDYQESLNLIASAGINNHVCLWNPYVVSKPVGILRGHMQVIVAVNFIHDRHQLISFSKDKVMRVWDINLQICVQRLTGIFPKGPEVSILLFYDQELSSLMAAFNSHIQVLKMKRESTNRVMSHDSPVTEVIYNEKYGHVISVDESSCLTIWSLNNGQKVKNISEAHGDAEITTVCLDHSKTRILTAGTDGNIKIWDINGNCHHVLIVQDGDPCEISQVLYLKRVILAIGWSKVLCCFPTAQVKSYFVHPTDWNGKQEHYDDILVADFNEPRTLVTGSYDGDIVFWNLNTQNSMRKIANSSKLRRNNCLPPLSSRPKSRLSSRKKSSKFSNRASEGYLHNTSESPIATQPPATPLRTTRPPSSTPIANENASSVTVTSIGFLKKRSANDPLVADLYSCHSDGCVRFWNSLTCNKLGEFLAFERDGNIVSCVDSTNKSLGVAGETGTLKLWHIESYIIGKKETHFSTLSRSEVKHVANQQPLFLRSFATHSDCITSMKFIEKSKKLFILTASLDCSVVLHALDSVVGIFGQNQHWNVNDLPALNIEALLHTLQTTNKGKNFLEEQSNAHVVVELSEVKDEECNVNDESITENAEVENSTLNSVFTSADNTDKTSDHSKHLVTSVSGCAVKNNSIEMRKRDLSYNRLETKQMDVVGDIEKPDFIDHPEKYFLNREDRIDELSCLADEEVEAHDELELILKHDEKSIFPKYILDLDTKMRTSNRLDKQQSYKEILERQSQRVQILVKTKDR